MKRRSLCLQRQTLAAIREVELPQLERSPNVTVSERIVPDVDGNPDIRMLIVTPAGVEAGAPGLRAASLFHCRCHKDSPYLTANTHQQS
jgi:hypothetical protein